MLDHAGDRVSEIFDTSKDYASQHPYLLLGAGLGALVGGLLLTAPTGTYTKKPNTRSLTGGGIEREKVKEVYDDYYGSYGKGAGEGITDRSRTTGMQRLIFSFFLHKSSVAATIRSLNSDPAQSPGFTCPYADQRRKCAC